MGIFGKLFTNNTTNQALDLVQLHQEKQQKLVESKELLNQKTDRERGYLVEEARFSTTELACSDCFSERYRLQEEILGSQSMA